MDHTHNSDKIIFKLYLYLIKNYLMTLEQLTILHWIVEDGGLNSAAQRLNKTPPALSMAIKKLEQSLGFSLLNRDHYRLTLTEQGRVFYHQAKEILQGVDRLQSLGHQLAQGVEPLFSISYEQAAPPVMFQSALSATIQQFQATRFNLMSGYRFSSLESLNEGKADLGIGPWFHVMHSSGDYDTLHLGNFHLILVAHPELFHQDSPIPLTTLSQFPIITAVESKLNFDNESLTAFKTTSQMCKVNTPQMARQLLIDKIGWGMIPKHYVENDLAANRLRQFKVAHFESEFSGEVRAYRRLDVSHGPVAQYIWQQLKARIA